MDIQARAKALRDNEFDPTEMKSFIQALLDEEPGDAEAIDELLPVVGGLTAAIREFDGIATAAAEERASVMSSAKRRFAIHLSALMSNDDINFDSNAGSLATSVHQLRDQLRDLAQSVASLVEQTISDADARAELEVAGHVQQMLVPTDETHVLSGLEIAGWFHPASRCGGDWWSATKLGDDDVLLVIGDVTGHGVASALVAAIAKGAVELATLGMRRSLKPFQLARMLNRVIFDSVKGEYLMTGLSMRYESGTKQLAFANAGHRSLWHVRDGKLSTLKGLGDPPLGSQAVYRYEEQRLQLKAGDIMVMFTDGIPEAESPEGDELGERPMKDVVRENSESAEAIVNALRELVNDHVGDRPHTDDLTMVVIQVPED